MIMHNCIKCGHLEMIPMVNEISVQRYVCPNCGEEQYILHSRIQPMTYPKNMVIINEKTKEITLKGKGYL